MHIKEVILDGFKSYGKRTVAGPFDEQFNAITGLNGSGKSNILDSICFVLGISKLSQVRCANLQGLVYKNGQAGVTKASVTIVFDNKKPGGPLGYDQHDQLTVTRQVVIGGRNKYLINGHVAQQKQVQDLFHSVQLNVNNPHFLIMQGRITKVLNMNPDEILGLIEEAAGTRMYEDRKNASQNRMAKKDDKVKEINRVLAEQITPQMEKLDSQRKHYQEWSSVNAETERIERFTVAFRFVENKEDMEAAEESLESCRSKIEKQKEGIQTTKNEMETNSTAIEEIIQKKESVAGEQLRELQEKESNISKLLVQENTQFQNKVKGLESDKKSLKDLEKQAKQLTKSVEQGASAIAKSNAHAESCRAVVTTEEENLAAAHRNLQALSAGLENGDEGEDKSMEQKLREAEALGAKANSEKKVGTKKLKMFKTQHLKAVQELKKEAKSGSKLDAELLKKKNEVESMQGDMVEMNFDETKEAELQEGVSTQEMKVSKLEEEYNNTASRLSSGLRFDYVTPGKSFDRKSVRGVVANLITVREPDASTSLEVAAGGKLYAVVVDTAENAKKVLTKGKLKRRVTIIPMDKMSSKRLQTQRMDAGTSMYPSKVRTAISLVGYPDELEGAMRHVFGSTLVCDTLDIAKKVTFHQSVKLRSVTLEGDSVDPSGTMSGGSRGRTAPVLTQLAAVASIRRDLCAAKQELDSLQQQLNEITSSRSAYEARAEKFDLAKHQLKLLQDRIGNSKRGMLQGKVDETQQNIVDCEEMLEKAEAMKKESAAEIKTLSTQLADLEKSREAKMKTAEALISKHKKKLQQAMTKLRASEAACEQVKLELEQMESETASLASRIESKAAELEIQRSKVTELQTAVMERKTEYENVASELRAQKEEMAKCEQEMKSLMKLQSRLEKRLDTYKTELKKTETKIARVEGDLQSWTGQQSQLIMEHPWIETEKQFFGARGTDYDFSGRDLKQTVAQLKKLRDQSAEMEKNINRKVMGMIQKAETEYQSLMKKRKMLENDRTKIEEVIGKLDNQKKEALEKTWEKVTVDFGSIFSTLLPGTNAKLHKVGACVVEGLEVKVAFSGVWKASLSELSGGQRSLVALSLILALLRFKPAPFYILDEVDAALDLSHTQNIGHMLKTHFKNSQFVVVSLKEGMFNNANVIFRTQFIDGMSTVRRTIPAGAADRESEEVERTSGGAKSGKRSRKGSAGRKALTTSNR